MTEWQPIYTAPKGEVLLYYPALKNGRLHGALPEMWRVGHANDTPFRRPTHWMPLPEPPEEAPR